MGQGIIWGAIWGLVVSAVILVIASLVGEQPAGNAPPEPPLTEAPLAGVPPAELKPAPEATEIAPSQPRAPFRAPQIAAPDAPPEEPLAGTGSAALPEATGVDGSLVRPDIAAASGIDTAPEAPVAARPQSLAPQPPMAERELTISAQPAQPAVPAAEEESGTFGPGLDTAAEAPLTQGRAETGTSTGSDGTAPLGQTPRLTPPDENEGGIAMPESDIPLRRTDAPEITAPPLLGTPAGEPELPPMR